MPTYEKKLKRSSKDGCVVRYIGKNSKGVSEKFRLGFDLREAERREALIRELWAHQEANADYTLGDFHWSPSYLKAAKAIAKGKQPVLPPTFKVKSDPAKYVEALNQIGDEFHPADEALYEAGITQISQEIRGRNGVLSARDNVARTGQTVADAIAAFRDHLHTAAIKAGEDEALTSWGKARLTQLDSWKRYLTETIQIKDGKKESRNLLELDLALVTLPVCQEMIDAVRLRPISFLSRHKKKKDPSRPLTRLTRKSASSIIKVASNFFEWLDDSDHFDWTQPRKFRSLNKKPDRLDADENYQRKLKKKALTIPDEHIALLSKYALPAERVFLLLGLNCAFGPGEIGQLRIPFIDFEDRVIDGIRFKTGNDTKHKLWPETVEGLEWQMEQRCGLKKIDDQNQDVLFLTDTGRRLWRVTKAGNYSNGITRYWNRLIERIQHDHKDFPSYSFGKLRKTAATRILKLAGAESASMILAHKTISEDELLQCYVQLPWERLFKAQEEFGEAIAPLLAVDRPAFERPPRIHIGLEKSERIFELDDADVPKTEIAKALKISVMTVYRHLARGKQAR